MKKIIISLLSLSLFLGCKKEESTVTAGSIQSLTCTSATFNKGFIKNITPTNATLSIPYTGGNSGSYPASNVSSTGVTGLTASIAAGSFSNSIGTLIYNISGTPSDSGTASFNISIGGKNCIITTKVANAAIAGSISSLSCSLVTVNGTAKDGEIANNLSISIPYIGGNGGSYSYDLSNSYGVTGLVGEINSDILNNGNGSVILEINGTPTSSGVAKFDINLAGKTCTVSLTVQPAGGSGGSTAQISTLDCAGATLPSIISGIVPNGSISIPYTSGNGGSYSTLAFQSTGVTGITATLASGNLNNGNGMLNLILSGGTNATTGTANFAITFAGKTCNLSLPVKVVVFKGKVDGVQYSGTPTLQNVFTNYFKFSANVSQFNLMSITIPKSTPNNTTLTVNKSSISSIAYQEGTTPWTTAFAGGTGSGTIFVEINDTINRKVKGTFSGSMENSQSTRNMTNGIFDFTY